MRSFNFLQRSKSGERYDSPDTIDQLTADSPLDFEAVLRKLPEGLEIGDERLDGVVKRLHQATINPIDSPLTPAKLKQIGETRRRIRIRTPDNLPDNPDVMSYALPLPVDAFIAAPEVIDWRHGRGRGQDKDGVPSRVVIKQNARRSAEKAPPIQGVTVYIRQDGAVFAVLYGDGAHRLCAAKVRQDKSIMCRDVTIAQL